MPSNRAAPVETEVKLSVPLDFERPALDELVAGARIDRVDHKELDARYFDTAGWHLLALGATLRHRAGENAAGMWTLKVPASADRTTVMRRHESNVAGPIGTMPAEIRDELRALTGTTDVVQVARLLSSRTIAHVCDADATALLEIDDDVVAVQDVDGRDCGSFREIEVEAAQGMEDHAALPSLVDRLRDGGAAAPDTVPKLVRALSLAGRVVRAGGGVVWRPAGSGLHVLVVHRPRYDDWSFPKGKADPGESDIDCAVREVREETGYSVTVGGELSASFYFDRKRRPKIVRWWAMRVVDGEFASNAEVDVAIWCTRAQARRHLSYARDATLLAELPAGHR